MTIDDWRYGFAWIGFDKDIKGSGGHGYDKPGQAHYSFTVELVAIDNRRPMIPVPNFLWVGGNYGFGFYTTANLGGTCPDVAAH